MCVFYEINIFLFSLFLLLFCVDSSNYRLYVKSIMPLLIQGIIYLN